MQIFLGLINNTALLLALWAVYGVLPHRTRSLKTTREKILTGLAISLIGIAIMLNPLPFAPGVIFDTRSILLSISGLFFGTVPTIMAVFVTSLFRLYEGGTGALTGVATILSSAGIGLAWRNLRGKRELGTGKLELFLMGLLVHVVMLVLMFSLPREIAMRVLAAISVPVLTLFPLATVLIGSLFSNQLQRKKLAQELAASEARYRNLFERASDAIFVADSNGRLIDVNTRACQMLHYSRAEFLTRTVSELIATGELEHQPLRIPELLVGENIVIERNLTRKDGSLLPVEISASLLPNHSLLGLVRDISRRKRAEDELRQSREQMRALSAYLKTALEDERTFIAHEIHEELGQMLVGLKMDLSWLGRKIHKQGEKDQFERLESMNAVVDEAIGIIRRIASDLRPGLLDDLGLVPALEWLGGDFTQRTGIPCFLDSPSREPELASEIATDLFRIYEEALSNIEQHASATRVDCSLRLESGQLKLEILDNGRGITPQELTGQNSLGLLSLRERAEQWGGSLNVERVNGQGTRVLARIPLAGNRSEEQAL